MAVVVANSREGKDKEGGALLFPVLLLILLTFLSLALRKALVAMTSFFQMSTKNLGKGFCFSDTSPHPQHLHFIKPQNPQAVEVF